MHKTFSFSFGAVLLSASLIGSAWAQAQSFSDFCSLIQTSYYEGTYKYELMRSKYDEMGPHPDCQMDRASVKVSNGKADITESDTDSLTIVATPGTRYTVVVHKGLESISRDVSVPDGNSEQCTIEGTMKGALIYFTISGEGSETEMYCHFDGNSHYVWNGDIELIEMTEFSLTFQPKTRGRLQIRAGAPSKYTAEFEYEKGVLWEAKNKTLPPATYEDEVIDNFIAYDNPFPDTTWFEFAGKSAGELYRRGVIGGFPDGEFKANLPVNRAEAAKFLLLARYGEVEDVPNNGQFKDVLNNQWYTKYVMTAANKGIINGHPDGTFRPADTVNTAEFLKMLVLTFDIELSTAPYSWRDVPADAWYTKYVKIAEDFVLYPNRGLDLQPNSPLTRGDVATAIYYYLWNR